MFRKSDIILRNYCYDSRPFDWDEIKNGWVQDSVNIFVGKEDKKEERLKAGKDGGVYDVGRS